MGSSSYLCEPRAQILSCYKLLPFSPITSPFFHEPLCEDFPGGLDGKASAYNEGDPGLIPGLGRYPGEGSGNPLQYSCLENPIDGVAWWATVHGVAKSLTRLSDFTSLHVEGWNGMISTEYKLLF